MKKIFDFLKKFFSAPAKPRCPHCGSGRMDRGYYTRGWNNLCNQAAGDNGWFCDNCCRVTFKKSLIEYKAVLPPWVTAYETK